MLRGLARCDHTSKQSKGRIYSDIYCAPTKQSAALPRSPAVLLLRFSPTPVSRLGLTWRSLPKGNCGWKSKEQTLHASAKKWKSRKSVWEPRAPGPLVQPESKVVRDCLKWTQSGYWKAEGGVPSLDPIGERCPGFRS